MVAIVGCAQECSGAFAHTRPYDIAHLCQGDAAIPTAGWQVHRPLGFEAMSAQEVREISRNFGVSQHPPELQPIMQASVVTCTSMETTLYRLFAVGRRLPFPKILPANRVVDGALQPFRPTLILFGPSSKDMAPLENEEQGFGKEYGWTDWCSITRRSMDSQERGYFNQR